MKEFDKTIQFFNIAFREGAPLKKPNHPHITADRWQRTRDVIDLYYLFEETSYENIGKVFCVSRERIRQIIKQGLKYYYQNCSFNETPFDELELAKPISTDLQAYLRRAKRKGSSGPEIIDMIKEGRPVSEFKERFDRVTLGSHRRYLGKFQIKVPYTKKQAKDPS